MKFLFFTIIALLTLSSCKMRVEKSGFLFDNIDTNFIQKDITSKNSLLKNMGSPSVITWVEDNEYWIYYAENIKRVLFMKPSIIERDVIVLGFNQDDRVNYYKKLNLDNEDNKFFFNINKTYVEGHKTNFIKDIFSNLGSIKP